MTRFNMQSYLVEHFPEISEKQLKQLEKLAKVFPVWNEKINLVSRKDIDQLFVRHILHSLAIAKIVKFPDNSRIIDVGTGGGFPGIPLAIMYPECQFDLVDSIGKKIGAVEGIADEIGLSNVSAIKSRAENLPGKYDFVISRAVTAFPRFVELTKDLFVKKKDNIDRGTYYLKGGDFESELVGLKGVKVYNLLDFFDFDFYETKKIIFLPSKR